MGSNIAIEPPIETLQTGEDLVALKIQKVSMTGGDFG